MAGWAARRFFEKVLLLKYLSLDLYDKTLHLGQTSHSQGHWYRALSKGEMAIKAVAAFSLTLGPTLNVTCA
jgi:hypothetical protein